MKTTALFSAIVALAVVCSVSGFDGFKLDDMGNVVSLKESKVEAKPAVGQSMERFKEASTKTVHHTNVGASKLNDPKLKQLVQEKAELAMKLAELEPARAIPKASRAGLERFAERASELKKTPEGGKLMARMTQRLSKNPNESADSFLNLLYKLKSTLTSAATDSGKVFAKVQKTCSDSEKSGRAKVNELVAREAQGKRALDAIRTKMSASNSKLAALRASFHAKKNTKPNSAIAMIEILQHNVVNHIPHQGNPMLKRAAIDALAESVATLDPGAFHVADKAVSALIEIATPSVEEEEIYCPEDFCQKNRRRDASFHGPRSAFVECVNPETRATKLPTVWKKSKGEDKRDALLNAGMHRQACTGDKNAPKSNKQKVFGILQRLRSALSGANPTATMEKAQKLQGQAMEADKQDAAKLRSVAKTQTVGAEVTRMEAEVDGFMSDEAAAEAAVQNYHSLLAAERKFKLDLISACDAKRKRQLDEQRQRKAQVTAVDMAILMVRKNFQALKHFLKGGNPLSEKQMKAMDDEAELLIDPDMEAARALEIAKKKQLDGYISKGLDSVDAKGVDPSLVKLEELSLKKGCSKDEVWCGTKRKCIRNDDDCPSAPVIQKDESGNQVVSQGSQSAFIFEDPIDKIQKDAELAVIREKALILKKKKADRKANAELRKRYEQKIKSINKRKEELQKGAEADQRKMKKIAAAYKVADAKATKLEKDNSNLKLDLMAFKEDLERSEKECLKYQRKADNVDNQTADMTVQMQQTLANAKHAALSNAEEFIHEEDDIALLRKDDNAKKEEYKEAMAELAKAQKEVKDAVDRQSALQQQVVTVSKMSLLETGAGYGGGYGTSDHSEATKAKVVAAAEKEKSYLLEARMGETKAHEKVAATKAAYEKARERVMKAMTVGQTLKVKEKSTKESAETIAATMKKTISSLEKEGTIAMNMYKKCRRERNALAVKISDTELKQVETERNAAEARTYAETMKGALGKAKVAERADEMEAAIVAEPLVEQSPIVSVACGLYLAPHECVANVACGWIPSVGCRTGSKSGPYFWDGPLPGWQYRKLDNAKCEVYSDCRQCIDAGCGWCGARLSCTEGTEMGPADLEACPSEYMPQWAHKDGRSRNACPVRQVVETESSMAQQMALRIALSTRMDMSRKENELEVKEDDMKKIAASGADTRVIAQEIRGLRSDYLNLKETLKANVIELRAAEKGKARTYEAGYAEGLKLAEKKHEREKGYMEGLKAGIEKAKNLRGPAGPAGPKGPSGTPGKNIDKEEMKVSLERDVKELAARELAKTKRMAEEAMKASKALPGADSMTGGATGSEGATGVAGASGMTGAAGTPAGAPAASTGTSGGNLASGTVAGAQPEALQIQGAAAAAAVPSAAGVPGTPPPVSANGALPAAEVMKQLKEPAEKGIAVQADDEETEDADMESRADAQKAGIKGELSPTEKAALEASKKAMEARVKEHEDKWAVQVSKFQTALADEKVVCDAAKQASLTALQLSKRKAQLQASLITAEKTIAKSQEDFATLTDELKVQTEKVNVAKEQVEDAKKELAAAPNVQTDPQFRAATAKLQSAKTNLASLTVTKDAAEANKKTASQDKVKAGLAVTTMKSELQRVIKQFDEKTEEADMKTTKSCPAARKRRAEEEAEATKLKAELDKVKFSLEKQLAALNAKATAGVRNMSFALSMKNGPYVSAGHKAYTKIGAAGKKTVSVEAWIRLKSFAPEGQKMVGLVASTGGAKGPTANGWALGADQDGFVFEYRREGQAVMESVKSTNPGATDDKEAGVKIKLNHWYHVAASFTEKQARIYVNGKLANFNSFVPSTISYGTVKGDFMVGSMRTGAASNVVIDDVAVWTRELTKEELNTHACDASDMKKELRQCKDEALMLYYNFGPGAVPGLNVLDNTKHGLDGKIYAPTNTQVKWVQDADTSSLSCNGPVRIGRSKSFLRR